MELHTTSGRRGLGFALACVTMLMWGILPLTLKPLLRDMDAATITWYRFGMSALLLGAFLARRGALPRIGGLSRSGWVLLLLATLGLAANYLAYLVGLDLTTPANAQVLIQLAPLLLALGGILVFREHFAGIQWLGLAVLLLGMGGFFGSQLRALAAGVDRYLLGVLTLVFAAVTWAVYGLAQKQLLRALPSQGIMLCVYTGCLLCFSVLARPAGVQALDALGLGLLVFVGLNTLLAYGAFSAALDHWEASRVSAVIALTPLATLTFSWLGARAFPALVPVEAISPLALLGALGVVLGSLLMSVGGRRDSGGQ